MEIEKHLLPILASFIAFACCAEDASAVPGQMSDVRDQKISKISDTVEQYLINPHGDIDGLLLLKGLQLHFPPHLSSQVGRAIKPGDRVAASGVKEAGPTFAVHELINERSKERIIDRGPEGGGQRLPPPPRPVPMRAQELLHARGPVKILLYGPSGDINGLVLKDQTIVRMPPETVFNLSPVIDVGQYISVEGHGAKSNFGTCIEAFAIGIGSQPRIPIYGQPR